MELDEDLLAGPAAGSQRSHPNAAGGARVVAQRPLPSAAGHAVAVRDAERRLGFRLPVPVRQVFLGLPTVGSAPAMACSG
jgi:hypothetical protein